MTDETEYYIEKVNYLGLAYGCLGIFVILAIIVFPFLFIYDFPLSIKSWVWIFMIISFVLLFIIGFYDIDRSRKIPIKKKGLSEAEG